jgi:hypothetical protein
MSAGEGGRFRRLLPPASRSGDRGTASVQAPGGRAPTARARQKGEQAAPRRAARPQRGGRHRPRPGPGRWDVEPQRAAPGCRAVPGTLWAVTPGGRGARSNMVSAATSSGLPRGGDGGSPGRQVRKTHVRRCRTPKPAAVNTGLPPWPSGRRWNAGGRRGSDLNRPRTFSKTANGGGLTSATASRGATCRGDRGRIGARGPSHPSPSCCGMRPGSSVPWAAESCGSGLGHSDGGVHGRSARQRTGRPWYTLPLHLPTPVARIVSTLTLVDGRRD